MWPSATFTAWFPLLMNDLCPRAPCLTMVLGFEIPFAYSLVVQCRVTALLFESRVKLPPKIINSASLNEAMAEFAIAILDSVG